MLLAERRRYDRFLQAHGMKRDQELRLRAFLRGEFSRGVGRDDAVATLRQQFGERTVNAQTAGQWYDDAAAGKEIIGSEELANIEDAANDVSLPFSLRHELNLPEGRFGMRASGFAHVAQ